MVATFFENITVALSINGSSPPYPSRNPPMISR